MKRVEYIVVAEGEEWRICADGVDCGVVGDREAMVLSAIRWAHRKDRLGYSVTVSTLESTGDIHDEWATGDPFPPLRFLAALMHRSSSLFVREWPHWQPDLYLSN